MERSGHLAVNGDPKDFHLSKALKKTVLPEDRARRIIDSAKIRRSRPLIRRTLGAKWAYAGAALLLCILVTPGKFSASNLDGGYVVNLETRDEIKVDNLHLEGATQQGNEAFVTFKTSLFSPQDQPETISLRTQTEDISLSWEDTGASVRSSTRKHETANSNRSQEQPGCRRNRNTRRCSSSPCPCPEGRQCVRPSLCRNRHRR